MNSISNSNKNRIRNEIREVRIKFEFIATRDIDIASSCVRDDLLASLQCSSQRLERYLSAKVAGWKLFSQNFKANIDNRVMNRAVVLHELYNLLFIWISFLGSD